MVLRVLVAVALLCSVAHADEKPWAKDVSPAEQKIALAKYSEANDLFEKGNYLEALPIYESALTHWDHPGIHYNTVVCLINLDRSVEAYEHLEKAMAYGEAPLGHDLFKQGQTYQRMLSKQVGTLEVTLKTEGAVVKLDGETLLDKPGTAKRNVLAKEHQLVAEKRNYETETRVIELKPGTTTTLVLEMKLRTRGKLQRRWARWKPWALVTTGGAVALVGAPLLYLAKDGFDQYDREFMNSTECSMGCLATNDPAVDTRNAAELKQTLAYSAFAVGGAAIAVGIALVVLNQPRLVGATVTPTVGKDNIGAVLSTSW